MIIDNTSNIHQILLIQLSIKIALFLFGFEIEIALLLFGFEQVTLQQQKMSDSQHNMSQEEQVASESESVEEAMVQENPHDEGLVIQQEQNDKRCATYIFNNEDHTLGNLLRTVLSGHSNVEFVGYSIPHPSQAKMNLRLQTLSQDTNDVLNDSLRTIQNITKTLRQKFLTAAKKSQK